MARYLASHTSSDDQAFQQDRTGDLRHSSSKRAVEKRKDWYASRRADQGVEGSVQAKEHRHGEEPGCRETDGYGATNCDGYVALWLWNLFRKVRGAIKASERPVGVDKADNKRDASRLPAAVVDESRKDERSWLMRRCHTWHSDQNHCERDQADVKRAGCGDWQEAAETVEDRCYSVH